MVHISIIKISLIGRHFMISHNSKGTIEGILTNEIILDSSGYDNEKNEINILKTPELNPHK